MKNLLIYITLVLFSTSCTPRPRTDTSRTVAQIVSTADIGDKLYIIIRTANIPADAVVTVALTRWPDTIYASETLKVNNGEQTVVLNGACEAKRQLVIYVEGEPKMVVGLECEN